MNPNPFQFPPQTPPAAPANGPASPGVAPPGFAQPPPLATPPAQAAPPAWGAQPTAYQPPVQALAPRTLAPRRFDGAAVAAAPMSGSRYPFLLEGNYLLRIDRTVVTSRNGAFVAEFEIAWSDNPERKAGMRCSWVQGTAKNQEVGFATIKRFAASVAGCQTEDELVQRGIDLANLLNAAAEPDQAIPGCPFGPNPMKDRFVCCRVMTVLTKDNRPFTRHDFSPYIGESK